MPEYSFDDLVFTSKANVFVFAAANDMLQEIKLLLDEGVDIDSRHVDTQSTALYVAAGYGSMRLVNFLLERGANTNIPGEYDITPLMNSCSRGKVRGSKIALRLIEAGANVNYLRKSDEMTALKFAVKDCKPEVIQALINAGADVDGFPYIKQTLLMLAARANNVDTIKVLVENDADLSLQCKLPWAENRTALELAQLENCCKAAEYLSSL